MRVRVALYAVTVLIWATALGTWYGERVRHDWERTGDALPAPPPAWVRCGAPVAHAFGRWEGVAVTNRPEAFAASHAVGFRVFEVDLTWDGDELVASHDPPGPENPRPATIDEVVSLLVRYPDAWLVLDTKGALGRSLQAVARAARRAGVLERVVPQLYAPGDLADALEIAGWPGLILTLYRTSATDAEVIRFASRHRLTAVTVERSRFTRSLAEGLAAHGIGTYVHTVNDSADAAGLLGAGARGVYTDDLRPVGAGGCGAEGDRR